MRATFVRADGTLGDMECGVILPNESEHNGGFSLYGFQDYEDKENGKMCHAVTGLLEFKIDYGKVGFRN